MVKKKKKVAASSKTMRYETRIGSGGLVEMVGSVFEKAPALPENIKSFIVVVAPWLVLLSVLASLPWLFTSLGLGSVIGPVSYMTGWGRGYNYMLGMVVLLATQVLYLIALPSLFRRQEFGWKMMVYAVLVSSAYNLLIWNLSGLIIGGILSLYLLFQIRESYR